jgi:hypothetical protein
MGPRVPQFRTGIDEGEIEPAGQAGQRIQRGADDDLDAVVDTGPTQVYRGADLQDPPAPEVRTSRARNRAACGDTSIGGRPAAVESASAAANAGSSLCRA